MDKGITFFFGYEIETKKRAKLIKEAGFDCVMTNFDPKFNKQNGTKRKQVRAFKENNLKHTSLHMRYKTSDLPHFFRDDKIGKKLEKTIIKDLKDAKRFGFKCVVVQLIGQPNEVGIKRFERILKVCEEVDIPLALENLDDNRPLFYFFENYKKDYVKFCYDIGHHHVFYPEIDYLGKYGDRLICLQIGRAHV